MNPRNDAAQRAVLSAVEPRKLARGLGWFSVALGVAELLAPRTVARAAGIDGSRALVRLYGLREIACGIGILMARNPAQYVWARVGGDVIDIATVASQSGDVTSNGRGRAIGAVTNLLAVTALDVYTGVTLAADKSTEAANAETERYITLYSMRTGFPQSTDEMHGAARDDFEVPADMRTPEALRPWINGAPDMKSH
ncbi:hypothetical protein [Caballeronia sp. INDeC2]|uniref:hypothetical protein n=1 Tax=Caballeronia sp. INDeC2 TaxID=2921747 RepID=UPI00202839BD|nr:hypothetical protein [Caballeronia sp. INDeC2]